MKKKLLTYALLIGSVMNVSAQQWIDVTDSYVMNPRYDNNNYDFWYGTSLSGYDPMENAEHYQKTFDTYQDLYGLPVGKYKVSLKAFYRQGTAENDYNNYVNNLSEDYKLARLYAMSSSDYYDVGIASASSGKVESSLGGSASGVGTQMGWWGNYQYYIPNNMLAAYYWFDAGYYQNQLECEVNDDGYLCIGIRKDYILQSDWTCIDDWKLEYWGTVTNVSSIMLSEKSLDLAVTEVHDLTATVLPENATYRNVTWSSSNENVAVVDSKGQITAVGKGTCTITATSKDGAGVKAVCTVNVTNNAASSDNLIINEIMAANVDVYRDPSTNFGSWVELYNPTSKSVILGGLYITDDASNLKKHRLVDNYGAIPANGYALLNFDHHEVWTKESYRQIDDKLDCDGGVIIISDGKNIIAQQEYPEAISRVSYARTTDGGESWGMTGEPTPGSSNNASAFATQQLPAPVVDKDAQLFTGTMQICVNIPEGATLRYTTDGTSPDLNNGEVSKTGIFKIDYTTCYRFRLFKEGYLPSSVVTRTYIYNTGNYKFPIISVVTDRTNIDYDNNYGVFMKGEFGRPGSGQTSKCNWNMDWDRPVNFEYITEDNECVVSQECDFAMCGGWSRAWTPHSFKLKATKTYDLKNTFDYQFFPNKGFLKHKTLQIRNGGNDTSCRIKDGALQEIVARSGMNVDYQSWQPVHVFINGDHYAVLNMREPNNKHYAYANYGIDTDEMDQFEMSPDSGYVQMEGTDEAFLKLVDLSANADDEETYKEIEKLLDIDAYINYMAIELYTGNWDWPQNNVKGFRDVNDGRFRFVLFDMDGSFSTGTPFDTFFGKEYYSFDGLHGYDYSTNTSIEGQHRYLPIYFVTLFKNMLNNESFRKKFIDTFCIVGGSVFTPARSKAIVNELSDYLGSGNWVYPSSTANDIINNLNSRNTSMISQLRSCSYMKLSSKSRQYTALSANVDDAKIMINDIEVPYSSFSGYLFSPIKVKAVAPAGYKFVGWTGSAASSTSKSLIPAGSAWKYYDSASLDGKQWYSSAYSDASWKTGTAPLGYGKSGNATNTLTSNKTCYYFRKSFTLDNTPSASDTYTLDYTIDDGMIVYVNGVEAGRYNMPSGSVSYNDVSSTYANGNPDTGSMTISGSFFKKGTNVIAVEVHNNQSSSSDIMWDASLSVTVQQLADDADIISIDEEYTAPTSGNITLTAVFEELTDKEMIANHTNPIMVNEISASNSMFVSDLFKKSDWVELYNTTSEDIDIAGKYLSDNSAKPEKYQIPSDDVRLNTIVPAHGYKVIWCDKNVSTGSQIHASFKLDADGGIVLFNDGSYIDSLSYSFHTGVQSFGRYPDGGNVAYLMNYPTISRSNIICSNDEMYEIKYNDSDDYPSDIIRPYIKEGGMTIAYVDGVVNVKSEESQIASLNIVSISGTKTKATVIMRPGEHFASVNVADLPKGIYIASAQTITGDECHIKFMKK
ncbi:MAG: CotH kinase family protein [Prevotellaceae bacterium]|nr:CotH kinase family protein [Candidatus Minthosoma equi]